MPAVAGIGAGSLVGRLLPRVTGFGPSALSFAVVSLVMLVTIIALERVGRRLLPPAGLEPVNQAPDRTKETTEFSAIGECWHGGTHTI